MIDREDLVFATCYQLAQIISMDWEDQPMEVTKAIAGLEPIDEPGSIRFGIPLMFNPLNLTLSEKEPDSIYRTNRFVDLKTATDNFKKIMEHSDGWQTEDSETIKKEIISRITTYEKDAEKILTPMSVSCHVKL